MLTRNSDKGRILNIMGVMNGMNVMNGQETAFETGEAGATEAAKTKAAETVETSGAVEATEAAEALEYLHKRFPEVDDIELINLLEKNASSISDILEAKSAYEACSNCDGTSCRLPERLWRGYHVISLDERTQSNSNKLHTLHTLRIGATIGKNCKYDPLRGRFGELFHKSGLVRRQVYQTFETLEDVNQEITMARIQAKKAAIEHSNIILAGRAGVGKTHLAAAIANYIMREEGRQARFRLVNELLDELRQAARYASDYLYVINGFKMTPCLILDDLGKEKTTDAGLDYLHQIIDYRYRNELQTIVTTNALTVEELSSWGNANFITPMVSRLLENGVWVSIRNSGDYRVKIRERKEKRY